MKVVTTELLTMLGTHRTNTTHPQLSCAGKTLRVTSRLKAGGWLQTSGDLTAANVGFCARLPDLRKLEILLKAASTPFTEVVVTGADVRLVADGEVLATLETKEHPYAEQLEQPLAHLNGAELVQAAKRLKGLVPGPNTVVALHFGQGEVKALGTDGFKIFCDRIPCTAPKHAFTFAFEACAELARLGKGGVSVKKRGDDLTFQQNSTKLTLRGLERTFPNYPRVLTWQVYGDTVFETEPVRAFLLDAAKLNRHQNRRVDLRVLAGTLQLKALDEPLSLALAASHSADFALAFDAAALLASLPNAPETTLTVTGRETIAALTALDQTGFACLMPLLRADELPPFQGDSGRDIDSLVHQTTDLAAA